MKIILKQNVENLGQAGDVVTVKDGFGRNYLIPRGMAVLATRSALKIQAEEEKIRSRRQSKALTSAQHLAEKLKNISVTTSVAVGEDEKIFGSVTSQNIADLLAEKGYEIDKRHINLDEPIKELGVFSVPVKLHTDVTAEIKVWVVKE